MFLKTLTKSKINMTTKPHLKLGELNFTNRIYQFCPNLFLKVKSSPLNNPVVLHLNLELLNRLGIVEQEIKKYQPVGDYASKSDLNVYASKSDLTKYQPAGNYAQVSELSKYQPAGDYAQASELKKYQQAGDYAQASELKKYQPAGDYAQASELSNYQPVGNYAQASELSK
jgi:hypothetical protein